LSERRRSRRSRKVSQDSDSYDDQAAVGDLNFDTKELKSKYATEGPDGQGPDELIKNPADLEEAVTSIFSKWTQLQHLKWSSYQLPFFSSTVKALAQHRSLETLDINISACDEDHLTSSPLSSPPREFTCLKS